MVRIGAGEGMVEIMKGGGGVRLGGFFFFSFFG